MKLSIIIPAYNSEKVIEKCLCSCLNQDISHNDYEIIVVDDGSTDNTKNIVLSMKEENNNIVYIYQTNAAQGAARNNGLSKAQGKYIWFIDSDDWIKENILHEIIEKLDSQELTAVLVGHATVYAQRIAKWEQFNNSIISSGKDLLRQNNFFISPTYAIWNKDFLLNNNIRFIEHIYHEDAEICPRMYYKAKRIGFINEVCYYVYPNLNSTTRRINPKRAFDLIRIVQEIELFNRTINEKEIQQIIFNFASKLINNSLYNSYQLDTNNINRLNIAWYKNKNLLKILCKSNIIKYKIEGCIFLLFPYKICSIYQIIQFFNQNPGNMNIQNKLLRRNK